MPIPVDSHDLDPPDRRVHVSPQQLAQWLAAARRANATGDHAAAARWAEQATRAAPQSPQAWLDLAVALRGLGNRGQAARAAKKAAAHAGDSADAHCAVGTLFLELDALAEAERSLGRSLALDPHHPVATSSLGRLQWRLGRTADAEASFRRAIAGRPDLAAAHAGLCRALNARRDHGAAEAAARRAIELDPLAADAWTCLGAALAAMCRFEAAGPACRRAVEIEPRSAEAWRQLGAVLAAINRPEPAEAALQKAVDLAPGDAAAWRLLAEVLVRQFRLAQAEVACRKAAALDRDAVAPHALLAWIHVQRWDYARAAAEHGRALGRRPHDLALLSLRLYSLNLQPAVEAAAVIEAARAYDQAAHRGVDGFTAWNCVPDPARRLRVGLVSGDLYRHPVGFFLEGPLRELDAARVELYAYSCNPRQDEVTARLRPHVAVWRQVAGLADADLARLIHDDGVDVLVDLAGHTEHGRLAVFPWRPAPVQATWLGYFATTGLHEIDWKIGDPWVTPKEEENHFSERIWRLPVCCYCFAPPAGAPPVAELPSRANGYVTYGCLNNLAKLNDGVVETWARVLRADPGARLLLKSKPLRSEEIVDRVRRRFAHHGVGAERLLLEPAENYPRHLEAYARVDVALDPFPYTGGATTAESLWMGVPVLTLRGDRYIGHQGETLLHAAGLPGWIAADRDEYVRKALQLAADRDGLAQVRSGLRVRTASSPLFDAPRFARDLEAAWRGMWTAWCDDPRIRMRP